jgi:hypothetical protein
MHIFLGRYGWRLFLFFGGLAIAVGGSMHPGGTTAEMLAHPDWLPGHALVTLGFIGLSAGLLVWGRVTALPPRTAKWLAVAFAASVLQSIDMAIHTAAMVDLDRLIAGQPTPVLTTHLWMTAVVYPLFAAILVGFLVAASRDRLLGSWWIAWLGIIGAIGHGLAGPLVVGWNVGWARNLFALILLVAIWMIGAAGWPARRTSATIAT